MGFFCAFKCLFCWDKSVVYDMSVKTMKQCQKNMNKRSIIIQGGPGTVKSVLSINLLKECISKGYNTSYVNKSKAPREAYIKLFSKSDLKKAINIKQLFRLLFGLCHSL